MLSKRLATLALIAGVAGFSGCSREEAPTRQSTSAPAQKPTIAASAYHLGFFTELLVEDDAVVVVPIPDDENPADWSPSAEDIQVFQQANLIIFNGATMEEWATRASLPTARIVNTSGGFRDDYIVIEDAVMHHHGDGNMHSHDGIAPHTWTDPLQALRQADAIRRALHGLLPEKRDAIDTRFEVIDTRLKDLHSEFLAATQPLRDIPMLASHPVYDYFARRYRLSVRSVHFEPDVFPTDEEWAELDELLAELHAPFMLWEDEPLEETVTALQQRGITPIVFHILDGPPDDGDFFTVMFDNAETIAEVAGAVASE